MFEFNLIDLLLMSGAIAWISTAIAQKDGPWKLLMKFRLKTDWLFGGKDKNPFNCSFCTSFWVAITIVLLYDPHLGLQRVIALFGLMGIGMAIRGMSQEFG